MSSLLERFETRAAHVARFVDHGHSVAVSFDTVQTLLDDYRSRLPPDILERFTAACAKPEPPTHVLLKPSAFIRLSDGLCQDNHERPAADYTDVP